MSHAEYAVAALQPCRWHCSRAPRQNLIRRRAIAQRFEQTLFAPGAVLTCDQLLSVMHFDAPIDDIMKGQRSGVLRTVQVHHAMILVYHYR